MSVRAVDTAPARTADGPPPSAPASALPPARDADAAALLGPYACWPYVERRRGADRRGRPTPMFSIFLWRGRRAKGRRRGEDRNIYVDRYARPDLWLAASVLLLNILDAWLTVVYLGYGGAEANPVARYLLERGVGWFLAAKCFAVSVCLLFLVQHKNFAHVKPALRMLLAFYGALLLYHVYLQADAVLKGVA
ncbi:MAG TPA: DUF5658 family protein [Planctomycetota bacterium]|nr:DUF5658 family protein [Planctomycetota bacterium]